MEWCGKTECAPPNFCEKRPKEKPREGATPRWVTSWPDWYGISGNVAVVPESDYLAAIERERLANMRADQAEEARDAAQLVISLTRTILAGNDAGSLPNDFPVDGMAAERMKDLLNARRELEAAQSATPAMRWRDAKVTVPCDGDNVLAYWCAVVGNGETAWCVAHYYDGRWHNPDDDEDDYRAPDFWTPLPAAPDNRVEQEGKDGKA
jgi:hypothetical protein